MSALVIPMFFGHLEPESNRSIDNGDTIGHLTTPASADALLSFAQCILCAVRKFCKLQVAAVRPLSPSTESSWKTTEETIVHICCWCNMAHARQTGLLQTAILVTF